MQQLVVHGHFIIRRVEPLTTASHANVHITKASQCTSEAKQKKNLNTVPRRIGMLADLQLLLWLHFVLSAAQPGPLPVLCHM